MLVILAFIIIFHIVSTALLFISTIDNAWWVGDGFSADLWRVCTNSTNCTEINSLNSAEGFEGYSVMQAVQATMILSTILSCISFLIFLLQLFRLKQGERFVLTAIIQLMSCLCVMIGASIYTDRRQDFYNEHFKLYHLLQDGCYGYSFILAWVAFAFTFVSGFMYMILRKRK